MLLWLFFFFSSRRRHTSWNCDWSSDVCSSDLRPRRRRQRLRLDAAVGPSSGRGQIAGCWRGRRRRHLLPATRHAPRRPRRRVAEDRAELRARRYRSERNESGDQRGFEQQSGHQAAPKIESHPALAWDEPRPPRLTQGIRRRKGGSQKPEVRNRKSEARNRKEIGTEQGTATTSGFWLPASGFGFRISDF